MPETTKLYAAFADTKLIGRGPLLAVTRMAKAKFDAGGARRIVLFDDESGRPIDVDLTGTGEEVVRKLAAHPVVGPEVSQPPVKPRGPGRPRLGVVSREISLLPRHWEWLAQQRGGASAMLRRLVDLARKEAAPGEQGRRARDAAYSFISDMAGDLPGFEEASRALFAGDFAAFEKKVAGWPEGIREQLARFIGRARDQAGQ